MWTWVCGTENIMQFSCSAGTLIPHIPQCESNHFCCTSGLWNTTLHNPMHCDCTIIFTQRETISLPKYVVLNPKCSYFAAFSLCVCARARVCVWQECYTLTECVVTHWAQQLRIIGVTVAIATQSTDVAPHIYVHTYHTIGTRVYCAPHHSSVCLKQCPIAGTF